MNGRRATPMFGNFMASITTFMSTLNPNSDDEEEKSNVDTIRVVVSNCAS